MARNIQSFLRITSNVFHQNIIKNITLSGSRTLYSAASLGLDGYKRSRKNIEQQFTGMDDKFREKMQESIRDGSSTMVFTEDLKNMLHLAEDNENDLSLLSSMLVKYSKQSKEMRFGSFVFGPVVMRTYYYLDKPDEALAAYNDPALDTFFNQVISCQILMDLLYNHNRFAELRQVFESILERNTHFTTYPRQAITLMLGGCYKENTPDSMQYATNLWQVLKDKGQQPIRRSSIFFAALALNQGRAEVALEVLFSVRDQNYVTVRNLKVIGLSELNRIDDLVHILKMSLANDSLRQVKHTYTKEVIDKVEKAISKAELGPSSSIVHIISQLKQNGHVTDTKLDALITAEIVPYDRAIEGNRNLNNNFNSNYNDNYNYQTPRPRRPMFNRNQRPGLKELI